MWQLYINIFLRWRQTWLKPIQSSSWSLCSPSGPGATICIKKSFWWWCKPRHMITHVISKQVPLVWLHSNTSKTNSTFVPFIFRGSVHRSPWAGGTFTPRGADPLPRQSPLVAPLAGGCSWRLPLACQTASFCSNTKEEDGFHTVWGAVRGEHLSAQRITVELLHC